MRPESSQALSGIEGFLILLCLTVPGLAAGACLGMGSWFPKLPMNDLLAFGVLLPWWLFVLMGCCGFAGWISAAKGIESNRTANALKSAGLMFLFQLFLAPFIAFIGMSWIGMLLRP